MVDDHDDAEEGLPWIYLGTRKVDSSGRINIPTDQFDIETDDAVDAIVETQDGDEFYASDVRVGDQGRITLPGHQRRLHGVDAGDPVTVQFTPTGKRYNGDGEPEEVE